MRITLDLDDNAMTSAMRYAQGRTETEMINEALRLLVRQHQHGLLDW